MCRINRRPSTVILTGERYSQIITFIYSMDATLWTIQESYPAGGMPPCPCIPGQRPTQPSLQWVPSVFWRQSGQGLVLTTHPLQNPGCERVGGRSLSPLYAYIRHAMGWSLPLHTMDPKIRISVECVASDTELKTYKQVQFNAPIIFVNIQQISHNIDAYYINVQIFTKDFHSLYIL